MEGQGGFGKIQWISMILCILLIDTNGYLVYNLSYLLLLPKFDCWDVDPLTHTEVRIKDFS